jgi:protocatechuate 3,4-dioxygenase beta subunit
VANGRATPALRVELNRPAVITGRVLGENDQPRSGLEVAAVTVFYTDRGVMMSESGTTETDERGEYRISGLQAGEYYVIARDEDSDVSQPTMYPGVLNFKTATRITVGSGGEMSAGDFSLLPAATYKVSMKVVPPADWPVSGGRGFGIQLVQVIAEDRPVPQEWEYRLFQRDPDGKTISSAFTPGTYDLYLRLDDPTKPQNPEDIQKSAGCAHARVTVVEKDIDLGDLKVERGIPIRGRILFKDEAPANFERTQLRVVPRTEMLCYMVARPSPVAADNTFTIPNMARGNLSLRVEGLPEGYYVDSIRYAAREGIDLTLNIAGEEAGVAEITVLNNGGVVEGTARNAKGEPAAGALVVLLPPQERRKDSSNFKTIAADKAGAFRFAGLRPGEYRLLVWDGRAPEWRDPEVLRSVESRGTTVSVRKGTVSSAGNIRALGN